MSGFVRVFRGSADGSVHLWDTTAAAAAHAVCSMGGDPITWSEWARYLPGTPTSHPAADGAGQTVS